MIAMMVGKAAVSMKKEMILVFAVTSTVLFMPIIAVTSLTNTSEVSDSSTGSTLYTGTASTNNTYTYGYCTFWSAKRREDVQQPIPNNWGDAHDWDTGARAAHYTVDHTPAVHAIMQTDAGDLGHVAFVEEVRPDGTWKISEMNAKGWDVISDRTYTAADAARYNFIH